MSINRLQLSRLHIQLIDKNDYICKCRTVKTNIVFESTFVCVSVPKFLNKFYQFRNVFNSTLSRLVKIARLIYKAIIEHYYDESMLLHCSIVKKACY